MITDSPFLARRIKGLIYSAKARGEPCKRGEASSRTGCIPKSKAPTNKPKEKNKVPTKSKEKKQKYTFEDGKLAIEGLKGESGKVDSGRMEELFTTLKKMTVPELKKLAKLIGVNGKPAKKDEILAKLRESVETAEPEKEFELTEADIVPNAIPSVDNLLQGVKSRKDFVASLSLVKLSKKEKVAAVQKWMETIAQPVGDIKIHGMIDAEPMKGFEIDGVKIQWAKINDKIAALVLESLTDNMPDALWKATSQIAISTQRYKDDAKWENRYNTPGFRTRATGGGGKVCIYNSSNLRGRLLAHENGHNLAAKMWGTLYPSYSSDYGKAQKEEPPVTEYGANSPVEDFAEACMLYVTNKIYLKYNFPKKFAALETIFKTGKG